MGQVIRNNWHLLDHCYRVSATSTSLGTDGREDGSRERAERLSDDRVDAHYLRVRVRSRLRDGRRGLFCATCNGRCGLIGTSDDILGE